MTVFRPLLASTLDKPEILRFPVIVSPKLDGVRCSIVDGLPLSRNGKLIRNKYVQDSLSSPVLSGLDGELVVGPFNGKDVLNQTIRGVMSADGVPPFTYYVFDNFELGHRPFTERYASLKGFSHPRITVLAHEMVRTLEGLARFERDALAAGFEGVMIRRPGAPYKNGRSTPDDGILRKLKRFYDGEATVLEVLEGKSNQNKATINELGYLERSAHQENMVPAGRVGTLVVSQDGEKFNVSPGRMTQAERQHYWQNQHLIVGRTIKYKAFLYGAIDAPRFATFQAFRDELV
jgi:DNA ligase 1